VPELLILSRSEVASLIDRDRLIDAVAAAMADLSAGKVSMPPRNAATVVERSALLAAMPAYLPSANVLETKLVSVFPRNTTAPSHQAVIAVFDPETGTPVALIDGEEITAARTAAGSALSTRLLAREDARVLAILGTGVQARSHVLTVSRVRAFSEIRVAGRDEAKARVFAAEIAQQATIPVTAVATFADAMRGADVVCGCTNPKEPVVQRRHLSPGTHVTSVGFAVDGREVDAETVRDALVVVESRAAALAPPPAGCNDLLWAIRDGATTADHIATEIGELVTGTKQGRTSRDQITLYKSVGVAVQDAAAAALVLAAARERGIGRTVTI
jgi:ornithine cyclodeaminase/alanine dehydrogenase-like protein (mu-crystallin family)